jgi:hypothetical protein
MSDTPNEFPAAWSPMAVDEVAALMRGAPFFWCLAGGHALERLAGWPYRSHDDIDIVVLRPDQLALQEWLGTWTLAVADPPGTLRPWMRGELIPWRAHDIWAHRSRAAAWELQVMIQETQNDLWYFRRDDRVHGRIDDLATTIDGVPCLRPDLQLLFKAKSAREKDELDFQYTLPSLSVVQRQTLANWLRLTSPNGHPWIGALEQFTGP